MVDWKKAILEARRVLKSNGYLVVGDSGIGDLQSVVGQKYVELLEEQTIHQRRLRLFLWQNFLRNVYKIEFFGHLLDIVKKRENWETFLKNNCRSFEMEIIRWKETYDCSEVLKRLQDSSFSFQWTISMEIHKEIMRRLRNWIIKQRGNHFMEKIERKFKVVIVRFN